MAFGNMEKHKIGFPDFSRLIASVSSNWSWQGVNYTATEDCWIIYTLYLGTNSENYLHVDGVRVARYFPPRVGTTINKTNYACIEGMIPVKKGSVVKSRTWINQTNDVVSCELRVYGML